MAAAARVHDPEGHWPIFAAEMVVGSFDEAGRFGFQEELYVDLGADTFRRTLIADGYLLEQTIGRGGRCRVSWPHPDPSDSQRRRFGLSGDPCDAITPPRRFNEFLTGLPMAALGERTRFSESPTDETIDGQPVKVVTLTFDDDPNGQQWYLCIDPETKVMRAARFDYFNATGEWIYYNAPVTFRGMRLSTSRLITAWPTDRFIVEQRILLAPVP